MATRAVQCVASAARARARTAVTRHAAPACVALSDACGSTPVHGATACGSAGMRVGQWSQARCLATLTPTVGREAEIRPFEVTMGDVDASDGEWEVGAMSDVEGDEAEEVNPLDVLGAPQLVNAHDTPEEAAADLLLFRDHITSTPRVKLPPSLVSQVPDDNEELLDIAHLLDQNASLTYQARERIFNEMVGFMNGEFDEPPQFPPDAKSGKWMHLVNSDIQYRYRLAGLYSDSEDEGFLDDLDDEVDEEGAAEEGGDSVEADAEEEE